MKIQNIRTQGGILVLAIAASSLIGSANLVGDETPLACDAGNWHKKLMLEYPKQGQSLPCKATYLDGFDKKTHVLWHAKYRAGDCEIKYQTYLEDLKKRQFACESLAKKGHSVATNEKTHTEVPAKRAVGSQSNAGTLSQTAEVYSSKSKAALKTEFAVTDYIQRLQVTGKTYSSAAFNPGLNAWIRYHYESGWETGVFGGFSTASYDASSLSETLNSPGATLWTAGVRIKQPLPGGFGLYYSGGVTRRPFIGAVRASVASVDLATIPTAGLGLLVPVIRQGWGKFNLRAGGDYLFSGNTPLYAVKSGYQVRGAAELWHEMRDQSVSGQLYVERVSQDTAQMSQSAWEFGLTLATDFNL